MVSAGSNQDLTLDRSQGILWRGDGAVFRGEERRWVPTEQTPSGQGVGPSEAVTWLQKHSPTPCRVPVGVIGGRDCDEATAVMARDLGRILGTMGLTLLCGGKGGVMAAACQGISEAGGLSIGLLPDDDWEAANTFVSVPIATGIGVARNALIARASLCLVAVGGGYGTTSEVAFGLQFGRPVFALAGAPDLDGVQHLADSAAAKDAVARVVLALDAG